MKKQSKPKTYSPIIHQYIDDKFIEAVEDKVAMTSEGWDTENPKELCSAIIDQYNSSPHSYKSKFLIFLKALEMQKIEELIESPLDKIEAVGKHINNVIRDMITLVNSADKLIENRMKQINKFSKKE